MEEKNEKELVFPNFEDIQVSTKTFIVMTNAHFNIKKLFDFLPVTKYIIVPKKRGRKKKNIPVDYNKNIPDGSIISIDLANNVKGVSLKKKKKKEVKSTDYFRNSVTIVMIIENKKINFKISNNGKFQMTGVKKDSHAEQCIKTIWKYIEKTDIYKLTDDKPFNAIFIPAMRNIDFSLGFNLDREKIDDFFNNSTDYYSLLETSIGYTGVNIKIPVKKDIKELKIKKIKFLNNNWDLSETILYKDYLNLLPLKESQKKLDKDRFNTFLVFHSGKVIMSSMCEEFAKDTYYEFVDIVKNNHKLFREKLTIK